MALVLLVAGGLLMWGYSFANSTVHDHLAARQIYFPKVGSAALKPTDVGPYRGCLVSGGGRRPGTAVVGW